MECLTALRNKASASLASAQIDLNEVREKATVLMAGVASQLEEHFTVAKQAASKAAEPIAARIARALQAVRSAKLAMKGRADQARAVLLDTAAFTKRAAIKLRADVHAKGVRGLAQEVATYAELLVSQTAASAKSRAGENLDAAAGKAKELYTNTGDLVSQKSFQTTAASATAGAVALGAGGAVTGMMTGGMAGAAVGLPLALFTFGLSIPVGAVMGGGAGLVLGTAAGATTGFLGGGAAGYGVYQRKDDICGVAGSAFTKASQGAECVKGSAVKSVVYAKGMVVAARARLARAGTGGTAEEMMD